MRRRSVFHAHRHRPLRSLRYKPRSGGGTVALALLRVDPHRTSWRNLVHVGWHTCENTSIWVRHSLYSCMACFGNRDPGGFMDVRALSVRSAAVHLQRAFFFNNPPQRRLQNSSQIKGRALRTQFLEVASRKKTIAFETSLLSKKMPHFVVPARLFCTLLAKHAQFSSGIETKPTPTITKNPIITNNTKKPFSLNAQFEINDVHTQRLAAHTKIRTNTCHRHAHT